MSNIFISFRAEESMAVARSLYISLKEYFGENNIFFFPESNSMGDKFKEKIFKALANSKIFIVLIGDKYLHLINKNGEKRLFEESDLVRQELEFALKNNLIVIPILIENAPFPEDSQLPQSLIELIQLDFHRISLYRGYDLSVQQLADTIQNKTNLKIIKKNKYNFFNLQIMISFLGLALLFFAFKFVTDPSIKKESFVIEMGKDTIKNTSEVLYSANQNPDKEKTKTKERSEGQEKIDIRKNQKVVILPSSEIIKDDLIAIKQIPSASNAEITIVQIGDDNFHDVSKNLHNFFVDKGYTADNSVFDQSFVQENKSNFSNPNQKFMNTMFQMVNSKCFCILNQNLEHRESTIANTKLYTLDLKSDLIFIYKSDNNKKFQTLDVISSGKTLESSLKDMERKIKISLESKGLNLQLCR